MLKSGRPMLAAVLNFFFPGAGYLYAGRRDPFVYLVMAAYLLLFIGVGWVRHSGSPPPASQVPGGGLAFLVLHAAFAYDGYRAAK